MRTELVLDALEMAVWRRQEVLDGLAATPMPARTRRDRYTCSPQVGVALSIGRRQLRQQFRRVQIGLYKTELTCRHGPWRTPDHVELAALG